MGVQPGIQAFQGVPSLAPPSAPIPMTAENQAAMQMPGSSAPDPNLQQGLIPGVVNTGMQSGPAFVPGTPPPMPQAPPAAPEPAPAAPPAPAPAAPQGPVMATVGGAPAHEVLKAGPTQIALINKAEGIRESAIGRAAEQEKKSALNQAMSASVMKDDAQAKMQAAQAAQLEEKQQMEAAGNRLREASAPLNKPIEGFWSDKSLGVKVGMALAAGLGAFGAAFGNGQNPAMKFLESAIDQDSRTKQMNFQRQTAVRDAAQQDFNNMAKQIGMQPASDLYKAAMQEKLAAQAMQTAASSKLPEIQAGAEKARAELQAAALERKATALMGYVQATKGQKQVLDPELGVMVPADKYADFQMKKALQSRDQQGQLSLAEAKEGKKTTQEGTKFIANEAQRANIPGTLASLDAAAEELKKGNTKGIGIPGRITQSIPFIGDRVYSGVFGNEASQREQDWAMVKAEVRHALTGAGMSDKERLSYETMLEGAGTPESRIHSIARAREAVVRKMNSIKAGAGTDAAAQFDQNLRDVAPPAIKSTPVK